MVAFDNGVMDMTIFNIERAGVTFAVDLSRIDDAMRERLFLHGLTQKIGDAAANADKASAEAGVTKQVWAQSAMAKVADALYAGQWGRERGASTGLSREERVRESIIRAAIKKSASWTAFKLKDETGQSTDIDLFYAAHRKAIDAATKARLESEKLVANLAIDL
jgi:hypothetical protein